MRELCAFVTQVLYLTLLHQPPLSAHFELPGLRRYLNAFLDATFKVTAQVLELKP
jgi:hypothetical protein